MAVNDEHRSSFVAFHRQWGRLQMSEKMCGTNSSKQTIEKRGLLVTVYQER